MVAFANRDAPIEGQRKAVNGRTAAVLALPGRDTRTLFNSTRTAGSSARATSPLLTRGDQVEAVRAAQGRSKDEIATPVKTFLSSNITPRSASRKARVDSASSTPNSTPSGTPSNSRPTSMINAGEKKVDNKQPLAGSGPRGPNAGDIASSLHRLSNVSGRHTLSPTGSLLPSTVQSFKPASPENLPMFFHASDIRASLSSSRGTNLANVAKKQQSSISANGDDLATDEAYLESPSPIEEMQPKFFYANGIPEAEHVISKSASRATSAVSSRTSPNINRPQQAQPQQKRATSPLKDMSISRNRSVSKASPRAYIPLAHNGIQKQEPFGPDGSSPPQLSIGRRSSLKSAAPPQPRHSKASSISSVGSRTNRRSSMAVSEIQALSSSSNSNPTPGAIEPQLEHLQKRQNSVEIPPAVVPDPASLPQSPEVCPQNLKSPTRVHGNENKVEQLNALAANARRERKVLDLEISNSSLLAINRTLEREMRKQTAELRRYRRLTSAGRISIAPSNLSISSRISSLTSTDLGSDSEEDRMDENIEPTLSSDEDESSAPTTPLSPTSQATRAAQQRKRDEKRLQLDLTRHQQLLVDSQRMNQSLKRCLGRTEDLITEGKKALAYQVIVSDLGGGGRVLTPDETDVELTRGSGLLSPSLERSHYPWEAMDPEDGAEGKEERAPLGDISEA